MKSRPSWVSSRRRPGLAGGVLLQRDGQSAVQVRVFALPPGQGATQAVNHWKACGPHRCGHHKPGWPPTRQRAILMRCQGWPLCRPVPGKAEALAGLGDAATFTWPRQPAARCASATWRRPGGGHGGPDALLGAGDSAAVRGPALRWPPIFLKICRTSFTVTGCTIIIRWMNKKDARAKRVASFFPFIRFGLFIDSRVPQVAAEIRYRQAQFAPVDRTLVCASQAPCLRIEPARVVFAIAQTAHCDAQPAQVGHIRPSGRPGRGPCLL